nr:hypothetical protein [uncultured Campylobacter sp.]
MNEIASAFSKPRNDAGNFRIPRDEIPQSSWGMTKNTQGGDFYRDCFGFFKASQ